MEVGGGEGAVVALPLVSPGERLACGMPPDQEEERRKKRGKRSGFERQKGWWVAFISQAASHTTPREEESCQCYS